MPLHKEPDDYCRVSVYLSNADRTDRNSIDVDEALVDTGSIMTIISRQYFEQLELARYEDLPQYPVHLADGSTHVARVVENLKIVYDDEAFISRTLVMGTQVLLGVSFLNAFNLVVYPRARCVCPLSNFIRAFGGAQSTDNSKPQK